MHTATLLSVVTGIRLHRPPPDSANAGYRIFERGRDNLPQNTASTKYTGNRVFLHILAMGTTFRRYYHYIHDHLQNY